MIIEVATAAAMFWADRTLAAEPTDIPVMVPALTCRYREPAKIRACLDRKNQKDPDPYQDMWDPNWVSSVTPIPDDSAKAQAELLPKSHRVKKP